MSDGIEPGRAVVLFEKTPTPIPIRVMRMALTTSSGRGTREGRSLKRRPTPLITVSGTKWMLDGVPLEFTLDPRESHKNMGGPPFDDLGRELPLKFSESEIQAMLRESLQDSDPLLLHVAGYRCAKSMLDAMQVTGGEKVWAGKRVRFEHGDGLFPDLIPRVKQMRIVVVENPSHLDDGLMLGDDNFFVQAQPLRTLLAATNSSSARFRRTDESVPKHHVRGHAQGQALRSNDV
jgi:predicted amidohydrolase YtcJ